MSAIARRPDAYEHVDPDAVGNGTRFVVSRAGRQVHAELKAKELGLELDGPALNEVVDTLKRLEHEGYHFEAADGSLELLMRRADGLGAGLLPGRVVPGHHRRDRGDGHASPPRPPSRCTSAASAMIATAEGNGPVNALDKALRAAIGADVSRRSSHVHLTDYKVRVLDTDEGHGRGHPGAHRLDRRRAHRGRPSASPRTSSRRRGRPWSTRSSTGSCTPHPDG